MRIRLIIFILAGMLTFTGCEYQKVLKKGSHEEKLDAARKYYNKGDYARAQILLDQLIGKFNRGGNAEEVYFLYAYSHFGMNDYVLAGYHFQNFTETYPRSKYVEQAAFMVARCAFQKTLASELDQTNTKSAIESIQLFINRYPQSELVEKGNELIDELRTKLHDKAYNNAMLYYRMGNYLSAYTSFKNAAIDYPDLPNKEEVEFMMVKSAYLYAKQSVLKFQAERYAQSIEEANNFKNDYPSSVYTKEVDELIDACNSAIKELNKTEYDTSNN